VDQNKAIAPRPTSDLASQNSSKLDDTSIKFSKKEIKNGVLQAPIKTSSGSKQSECCTFDVRFVTYHSSELDDTSLIVHSTLF
jgi:hypothetical protein